MALGHTTRLYGVNDAAVYKMTSDVAGTAPAYATKVDVPGVKSLELSIDVKTQTLRGDNTLLAADSVLDQLKGKLTYAKMGLDIAAALLSPTVTDSGTTPNQKSTWTLSQTDTILNHKIEAQTKGVDYVGGDVHQVLYKVIPGTIAAGLAEENYQEQSYDYVAMPLIGTVNSIANAWMSLIADETLVAIT